MKDYECNIFSSINSLIDLIFPFYLFLLFFIVLNETYQKLLNEINLLKKKNISKSLKSLKSFSSSSSSSSLSNSLSNSSPPSHHHHPPSNKKNWRTLMTGNFNQYKLDGIDEWLILNKKPFAARMIAPTFLKRMNHQLVVGEEYLTFGFNFGNDASQGNAQIPIAKCEAEAVGVLTENKVEKCQQMITCWIHDNEEALYLKIRNHDTSKPSVTILHKRVMLEDETIELVSDFIYFIDLLFYFHLLIHSLIYL